MIIEKKFNNYVALFTLKLKSEIAFYFCLTHYEDATHNWKVMRSHLDITTKNNLF